MFVKNMLVSFNNMFLLNIFIILGLIHFKPVYFLYKKINSFYEQNKHILLKVSLFTVVLHTFC